MKYNGGEGGKRGGGRVDGYIMDKTGPLQLQKKRKKSVDSRVSCLSVTSSSVKREAETAPASRAVTCYPVPHPHQHPHHLGFGH